MGECPEADRDVMGQRQREMEDGRGKMRAGDPRDGRGEVPLLISASCCG